MTDHSHADELDGPIAAPDHHWVVFENESIRVLETVIKVGDTTPVHTHLSKHVMIVSSGGHFIRRDANENVMDDTRDADPPFAMPTLLWSSGTPAHTLENIGDTDIKLHSVELKD